MLKASELPRILIIEFGGQLTLKIWSTNRENGYRSAILDRSKAVEWMKQTSPKGVVLSGGLASVYDKDAPRIPPEVFALGVPVLGICYGMQAIAHHFGGDVEKAVPQYAHATIHRHNGGQLFADTPTVQTVWSNHGDSVTRLPEGFEVIARYADGGGIAAIEDARRQIWGVQFHPEADQTKYGKKILERFAQICGCEKDWRPSSLADEICERTAERVGNHDEIIMGASGGVDSCTAAAILARKFSRRLHYITVDGGQFRKNELPEVRTNVLVATGGREPVVVEARERFFEALVGVLDANRKRHAFAGQYGKVFVESAQKLGPQVRWFTQGTLAPDRIESGKTGGAEIKPHHNEIADCGFLQRIDPLENLFKYEVRALARDLGLPESISERQPFPGPGLFIRHIGPITQEGIETAEWVDEQTTLVLRNHGIYSTLSQLVPAYFAQPVVGIKGDKRCYAGFAALRAVRTADFMTAEGYVWPEAIQAELCRVLGKHPRIVHVGFFPMDKPPATTEFE